MFEDHAFQQSFNDLLLFWCELRDSFKQKTEIAIGTALVGAEDQHICAHLPLYSGLGGFFTVNCDGEVVSYLWDDTLHGKVEFDPDIRNSALFQGSQRYPELATLIEKPPDAKVCSYCNGSGIPVGVEGLNTKSIICYCGGLGWVS